jgi:hypothetical protein
MVLRAFFVTEEKPDCGALGSFEAWSEVVPAAIVFAGGPNILNTRSRDGGAEDEKSQAITIIINLWPWPPEERKKSAEILHKVFDGENIVTKVTPAQVELRAALRVLTEVREGQLPNSIKLGIALKSMLHKVSNGKSMQSIVAKGESTLWFVGPPPDYVTAKDNG